MSAPVWLILPTYDEAENVAAIVDAARQAAGPGLHVLVVDDASPDGTGAIADDLAACAPETVSVLHRPAKLGLGPAYIAGFAHALAHGARYVLEMDADFSHDPQDIPRLLQEVRDGADVALGSRYVPGGRVENWSLRRRVVSRAGCAYARTLLRAPVRDLTGGFKCFRAETLEAIDFRTVRSLGYGFQVELTWRALRAGLHVVEVPITFRERREGRSKMTGRIALEAALLIPRMGLGRRTARR